MLERGPDPAVARAQALGLLSNDHFTVIEAWASLKSFRRKGQKLGAPDDPGNPTVTSMASPVDNFGRADGWLNFAMASSIKRPARTARSASFSCASG